VAGSLAELPEQRKYARWWEWLPAPVRALEGASLREDPTIRRLDAEEIERNRDLRTFVESHQIEPEDLLVYMAYAEGGFGRYRLAAIFLLPPDIAPPTVCCLDGPRGSAASEHRLTETELCLYYKDDPDERRWKPEDGLRRLFDLARRHVTGEHLWRKTGAWPVEEAPHGETEPARSDPSLALPLLRKPGRNEPCTCGSGRKAKRCCWR
jgi:SEC-C motif